MQRYPGLDLLRTAAILMMIVYHLAFDLSQFYGWTINVFNTPWLLFARTTAILFLLVSGASAAISFNRLKTLPPRRRLHKHLMRFVRIGAAAALVTAATYIANPDTYVRFGILHLIAVAGLLLPPFVVLKEKAALAGVVFIAIGLLFLQLRIDTPLLIPFGLRPADFQTIDYFPLFPWMGVILLGYGIGYAFYIQQRIRLFSLPPTLTTHNSQPIALASWPGRHALLLYLIHQPIIICVLWLLLGRPNF